MSVAHTVERAGAAVSACNAAKAVNLMLALQTLEQAEAALREHRIGFEQRLRLEKVKNSATAHARAALADADVDPDMLWKALL